MQTPSDIVLLARWRDTRDPHAFKTLAHRYGGLVFGICNRVLKNTADAEDVTQECFLKLSTDLETPLRSLGPWLHSVAVNASINRIRSEARRRDREGAYETGRPSMVQWDPDDLLAHVDEAIGALPELKRHCVVGSFLENKAQEELASELGISRRTVKRRTDEAIAEVRAILAHRGITTTMGGLAVTLGGLGTEALSPTLTASLGKIAVAGVEKTAPVAARAVAGKSVATVGGILLMKKGIGMGVGLIIMTLAAWWYFAMGQPEPISGSDALANMGTSNSSAAEGDGASKEDREEGTIDDGAVDPNEDDDEIQADMEDAANSMGLRALLPDGGRYAPKPITDPTKYAAVAGIVMDERGRAIPGAQVSLLLNGGAVPTLFESMELGLAFYALNRAVLEEVWDEGAHQFGTVTDSVGNFLIDDIPYVGGAVVAARATGYELSQTTCMVEAEVTTDLSLNLQSARAVHGTVLTPSGEAVVGARVATLGQMTENSVRSNTIVPEAIQTRTDARGDFSVWLGNYDEDDSGTGKEVFTGLHIKSAEYGEGHFSPVAVGLEERLVFTLDRPTAGLSGHIYTADKQPAAGYHILLTGTLILTMDGSSSSFSHGPVLEGATGADGAYEITDIPTFASYDVSIYTPDNVEAVRQPLPNLEAGESKTWDYTISPPIHVTGEVRDKDTGAPLPEVTVRYSSEDTGDAGQVSGRTETDGQGTFSLTLLSGAGTYRFVPHYERNTSYGNGKDVERMVDLKPGEDTFVALEMAAPASRRFLLVDQFGTPVVGVGAVINLHYGTGGMTGAQSPLRTDGSGQIEFVHLDPAAESVIIFEREGFVQTRSVRMDAQPGEALAVETLVLYQGANLAARLVDGTGAPVADASVECTALYGDGLSRTVPGATSSEGWLVLSGEIPGTEVTLTIRVVDEGDGRVGSVENVALSVGGENDLGDVVLTAVE